MADQEFTNLLHDLQKHLHQAGANLLLMESRIELRAVSRCREGEHHTRLVIVSPLHRRIFVTQL